MSVEKAAAWVGAKEVDGDYPALLNLLMLLDPGASVTGPSPTDMATFEHAWVRVLLPDFTSTAANDNNPTDPIDLTPNADDVPNYFDLDPSWKFKDYQPGIEWYSDVDSNDLDPYDNTSNGLFDEIKYLDETVVQDTSNTLGFKILPDSPLEFFESEVQQWLAEKYPGNSLADIPYDGPLLNPVIDVLPVGMGVDVSYSTGVHQGVYDLSHLGLSGDIANDSIKAEELTHRSRIYLLTPGLSVAWTHDICLPSESYVNYSVDVSTTNGISYSTLYADSVPVSGLDNINLGALPEYGHNGYTHIYVEHYAPGIEATSPPSTLYAFNESSSVSYTIVSTTFPLGSYFVVAT